MAKDIQPGTKKSYPKDIDTKPKQALYDNLEENEELSIVMDEEVRYVKDDDWRSTQIKRRKVEIAIRKVLAKYGITDEAIVANIFEIVSNQREY